MRSDARDGHVMIAVSPAWRSDFENLNLYSLPLAAWLHDQSFDRFCCLPGTPPSPRIEEDIPDLILKFDLLFAELEKGSRRTQGIYNESCGGEGEGSKRSFSERRQQLGRVGSSKPEVSRSQKNKRPKKDGSDNERDPASKKRSTKPDSQLKAGFRCRIYLLSDHTAQKQHKCRDLDPFTTFQGMVEHLLRIHFKPHQCSYCWNRFGRTSERKRHQDEICIPKGHPKVIDQVPDYVVEFSERVRKSTERNLNEILFLDGRKQYDIVDGTDELQFTALDIMPFDDGRFDDEIEMYLSHIGRSSNDEITQLLQDIPAAGMPIPSLGDVEPEGLAQNHRDKFLSQLEQEVRLAEQSGDPESVEQLVLQIAARLPPNIRGCIFEPQRTVSPVVQMSQGSSKQPFMTLKSQIYPQPATADSSTDSGVGKIGSDSAYMSRADDLHHLFESEGLGWMNGAIPF